MTANGVCRGAFALIVAIPKCLLEKYDLTQKLKSKIVEKWGYTVWVRRVCERLGVSQRDWSRVKCRWSRFKDDKWSRKGRSGLQRKEAKETRARGQTLDRINVKNGMAFASWKNTDFRKLQQFAGKFKWLLVVEFSLADCTCLVFFFREGWKLRAEVLFLENINICWEAS